mgnify:CR=1 FL=1
MNWKVKIDGDKQYLDDLNRVTKALDLDTKILKEGEEYFIEGAIFKNIKDAKEIAEKAKSFLIFLQATQFKTERVFEPLKIKEISDSENRHFYDSNGNLTCEIMEDGRKSYYLIVDDMTHYNISVGKVEFLTEADDGTITGGLFTIESIVNYIDKNDVNSLPKARLYLQPKFESFIRFITASSNDAKIKEVRDLISSLRGIKNFRLEDKSLPPDVQQYLELAEWAVLRNIYESIKNSFEKNSLDEIKDLIGKESADNFFKTACSHLHPKDKNPNMDRKEKPDREISLNEAEEIISNLVQNLLNKKYGVG